MKTNTIYEGDNVEVLTKFPDKSVDLIYLDPPFFSNRKWEIVWGDAAEIRSFEDRWKGGKENYIQWMERSLRDCYRILKDTGSIYLHCDWHANAHLRILLDEIFGKNNFRNEIVWCYGGGGISKKDFPRKHDTIFRYTKTDNYTFNIEYRKYSAGTLKVGGGRHSLTSGGKQLNVEKGTPINDWWCDLPKLTSYQKQWLAWPTQKPVLLLERIIRASSNPGDVVLDPFCGCGTTLDAAQRLGRKWVGIDVAPTGCKVMKKRMKKFGIKIDIIKAYFDFEYIKKMSPQEFQNWVVVDKFSGQCSKTMSNDGGIDGRTSALSGSLPIQVKQSLNVGRNVVDNFETAIRRVGKSKGFIVAYSFGKGANEEVARCKRKDGLNIKLISVRELLDDKTNGGFWK